MGSSMDCRGTACHTAVFTVGCRGISVLEPGQCPLSSSSSSLTFVSAGLFHTFSLLPLAACGDAFSPFFSFIGGALQTQEPWRRLALCVMSCAVSAPWSYQELLHGWGGNCTEVKDKREYNHLSLTALKYLLPELLSEGNGTIVAGWLKSSISQPDKQKTPVRVLEPFWTAAGSKWLLPVNGTCFRPCELSSLWKLGECHQKMITLPGLIPTPSSRFNLHLLGSAKTFNIFHRTHREFLTGTFYIFAWVSACVIRFKYTIESVA